MKEIDVAEFQISYIFQKNKYFVTQNPLSRTLEIIQNGQDEKELEQMEVLCYDEESNDLFPQVQKKIVKPFLTSSIFFNHLNKLDVMHEPMTNKTCLVCNNDQKFVVCDGTK